MSDPKPESKPAAPSPAPKPVSMAPIAPVAPSAPTPSPEDTQQIEGLAKKVAAAKPATPGAAATPAAAQKDVFKTVFTVAWMAILLGFAIEALLLIAAVFFGTATGPKPFIADLVNKVSWSFLVCVGLGFGNAISKARPGVVGLFGLLSAPLAFGTARSMHKGVGAALGLAATAGGPSPLVIALLKALQYALFGWVLGKLEKKTGVGLATYAGVGFLAGLLFGGVILGYSIATTPAGLPPAAWVARGISEILFPVGCAAVLYVSGILGKKAA